MRRYINYFQSRDINNLMVSYIDHVCQKHISSICLLHYQYYVRWTASRIFFHFICVVCVSKIIEHRLDLCFRYSQVTSRNDLYIFLCVFSIQSTNRNDIFLFQFQTLDVRDGEEFNQSQFSECIYQGMGVRIRGRGRRGKGIGYKSMYRRASLLCRAITLRCRSEVIIFLYIVIWM